jgi:succinoglycan biosynthesis transport protein ExoP
VIDERPDRTNLRTHLRVLRRRKWIVIATVALAVLGAVIASLLQQPVYQASAEVVLRDDNLAGSLTGVADSTARPDPARAAETQARLASVPTVAARALAQAGISDRSPEDLLDRTDVSASTDADVLTFTVKDEDPERAMKLATALAHAYIAYRQEVDTAAIHTALTEAQARLDQLERLGQQDSAIYSSLVDKVELLQTLEALQTSNAFLSQPADEAVKVSPKPARNALLALVLGGLLGVGLAFLAETLDTRVRSASEISAALRAPLLGRLPEPPRQAQADAQLVTLADPAGGQAEAFRVLRTNLEFVMLERAIRTVMVTSAVAEEGKSTTVANLAVAMARAGRHVVLVELDLRRPSLNRLFQLSSEPGLTDVALGRATLEHALTPVAVSGGTSPRWRPSRNGGGVPGLLEVLPPGPLPPDPGEFIATSALREILTSLAERADIVLVDAPPLLGIGDALLLTGRVDALVLVARLNAVQRPMLGELRRVLDGSPAVLLGFALAGAELEEEYYGTDSYYYAYSRAEEHERTVGAS